MRGFRVLAALAVAGLGVVLAAPAQAATPNRAARVGAASTVVTNCNDSGTGSLRAAVAAGGTATFALSPACSTIALTSGPITIAKNVTIAGPGAGVLAVSGGGVSQVFVVLSGVTTTISGLTIENGDAQYGAGGGVDNRGGTVTITDSTISDNHAAVAGGGICNGDNVEGGGSCGGGGTLTLTNSTVTDNGTMVVEGLGDGGGIATGAGVLIVTNSTISGNHASGVIHTGAGGGIANEGGTLIVTNSTVSDNHAGISFGKGGGIYSLGAAVLTNSTVSGNKAGGSQGGGDGGGIASYFGATLALTNSTVSGNTATFGGSGGGIYDEGLSASLQYSTISGNKLGVNGGLFGVGANIEVFEDGSGLTLTSSIVANGSPAGSNCDVYTPPIGDGGYNLDSDGSCGLTESSDMNGVDAELAPLAANGGPTKTMALGSTTPVFNAIPFGTNGCGDTITTDQRGMVRPFGQSGCEIGAYEIGDVALKSFATASPSVGSGANVTYFGTLLNGGATTATGVTVTDTLPHGLTFVSASASLGSCSFAAPTITCTLGNFPAAGLAIVDFTATVTAASGKTLHDKATVSATTGDTIPNDDTKTVTIHVT